MEHEERINIRRIAGMLRISTATVSRALSPELAHTVSEKQRARIREVCDRFQYMPNINTVRMFRNRSNLTALLVPEHCLSGHDSIDYNLAGVIGGIERTLSERGIYCSLVAVTPRFLAEKEYLRFCRSKMFDGFLLWGMTERETFVHELAEENPPVVSIQGVKNNPKLSGVNADDYRGMCDLVRRVLDCGHRRIGVIPALESSQAGRERNRAVRDVLEKAECRYLCSAVGGFDRQTGTEGFRELMRRDASISCIVCANDYVAAGVWLEACERGYEIPRRLSVTGADGLDFPGRIPLTGYLSPSFELGRLAAEMLLEHLDGRIAEPRQRVLETTFLPGATLRKPFNITGAI